MKTPIHIRTYTELSKLKTFKERYNYLKIGGVVGEETFGFDRFINQLFYKSKEWLRLRDSVIVRDNGCDLGIDGYEIYDKILIHHMNPITLNDIKFKSDFLLNPNYLISTTQPTHNAIHYGDEKLLRQPAIDRRQNDTCPWRH